MTSATRIASAMAIPCITFLLVLSSFVVCRPQQENQHDTSYDLPQNVSVERTQSSEFVFSPEKQYVNDAEVNDMLEIKTRDWRTPPFDTEERLWGTTPKDTHWHRMKQAVKKMLRINTEKKPWNVTREPHRKWVFRHLKKLHNYVRYTLLNRPTPNATHPQEVTEDSLEFWRAHYTDWKFFNKMHFEIMNASNPEEHWFYRTIMAQGYGVNLEDISTTTQLYFDINRMTHYSKHITLPTTAAPPSYEETMPWDEISSDIREVMTLRPAYHKAIDKFLNKLQLPTIPPICEEGMQATCFPEAPIYKKIRSKLISFYYITTRDPEEFMDSHENHRNKKLKKWLVKEEARLMDSVSKEIGAYVPNFGPKFNSFYTWVMSLPTTTSRMDRLRMNEDKLYNETNDGTTKYMPENMRRILSETRMFNRSLFEKFIVAHCANKSINWVTNRPTMRTEITYAVITEKTTKATTTGTGTTPTRYIVPEEVGRKILSENYTLNREKIGAMYINAQKFMKNLSLFNIEKNWKHVSQKIYNDQFTTTTTEPNSGDIQHAIGYQQMGNYRDEDFASENGSVSAKDYQARFNEAQSGTLATTTGNYQECLAAIMKGYTTTTDQESRNEEDYASESAESMDYQARYNAAQPKTLSTSTGNYQECIVGPEFPGKCGMMDQ
uniref:Uncharacterized protein n=1 Tax=Cacopsylla melanoneura TaxID=428564 RepID=A0A8D8XGN9_9HEMI